jgi:arylsulfatase A-like enzyme
MRHLTRRQFLETAGASAALVCVTGCLPQSKNAPIGPRGPNIIYILADDLGYGDLSGYGQSKFATPNIDRLAAEGLKFTQHYAGSTVCAPSRCALMTGLHTGHGQIRGNKSVQPEGQWPLEAGTFTLAHMLRNAGYATGAFGKWGLGASGNTVTRTSRGLMNFMAINAKVWPRNTIRGISGEIRKK